MQVIVLVARNAFNNGPARNVHNTKVDALKEQGKQLQEMCKTKKSTCSKKKPMKRSILLGTRCLRVLNVGLVCN
jgi:hypothetical protein